MNLVSVFDVSEKAMPKQVKSVYPVTIPIFLGCFSLLFYEFRLMSFEPFLALEAAEVIGFAFISNFELRCCFV